MPRARRAGGYMSPAAVRIRSETALAAPINAKPAITSSVESILVASAVTAQPPAPIAKPKLMTGVRPKRSIRRPAGIEVNAEAVRKIAGPRPRSPLTPVTRTNVSDDTAATSWSTAELTAIVAASRTVLRRTGRSGGGWLTTASFNQAAHATPLLQWVREACGDRRFARRRARRLQFVFPAADHDRCRAHVPAGRLQALEPGRRQAAADYVPHRPAVRCAADAVPHRQRSPHRCSPDHRAQRPRRDHSPTSEAPGER